MPEREVNHSIRNASRVVSRELRHAPAAIFNTQEGQTTFIIATTAAAIAARGGVVFDARTAVVIGLASLGAWGIGRGAEHKQQKIEKLSAENHRLKLLAVRQQEVLDIQEELLRMSRSKESKKEGE